MYENYWTSRVADNLGEYEILYGDYKKYSNQLELKKGIENDDIIRIANKYFIEGEKQLSRVSDYTSHNTKILDKEEVKKLLLNLSIVKESLND